MVPHRLGTLKALAVRSPTVGGAQSAAHLADGLEGSAQEGTCLVPPQDLIRLLTTARNIALPP